MNASTKVHLSDVIDVSVEYFGPGKDGQALYKVTSTFDPIVCCPQEGCIY